MMRSRRGEARLERNFDEVRGMGHPVRLRGGARWRWHRAGAESRLTRLRGAGLDCGAA
jgi:hypothetical protein